MSPAKLKRYCQRWVWNLDLHWCKTICSTTSRSEKMTTSKEKHHSSSSDFFKVDVSGYKIQQQSLVNREPRNVFFFFRFPLLVFQSNKPFDFCYFGTNKKSCLNGSLPTIRMKRELLILTLPQTVPPPLFFWKVPTKIFSKLVINPNIW